MARLDDVGYMSFMQSFQGGTNRGDLKNPLLNRFDKEIVAANDLKILAKPTGDVIIGECKNGVPDGLILHQLSNNDVYEGYWARAMKNG